MGYRRRIYFTEKQKAEIWDRWQRGESMSSIGRMFDRNSSSIYPLLSRTGGIRPPERKRPRLALRLSEREEISRGLRAQLSLRTIARQLRRAPSTISREVRHVSVKLELKWSPQQIAGWLIVVSGMVALRVCRSAGVCSTRRGKTLYADRQPHFCEVPSHYRLAFKRE